jgi:hypothetical protein
MQSARHKGCPYLWIDQECIDQNNPDDVEKHLRIMYRVYSECTWTVALLSYEIPSWQHVYVLLKLLKEGLPPKDERLRYIAEQSYEPTACYDWRQVVRADVDIP